MSDRGEARNEGRSMHLFGFGLLSALTFSSQPLGLLLNRAPIYIVYLSSECPVSFSFLPPPYVPPLARQESHHR